MSAQIRGESKVLRTTTIPCVVCTPGNLGDVIQPTAMENLLAVAAPEQCFWYAHPSEEEYDRGNRIGELFSDRISGDASRLIHLTPDHAEEVNRMLLYILPNGVVLV